MRIVILEHAGAASSGTGVRGDAIAAFLRDAGHLVDVLAPTPTDLAAVAHARRSVRARVSRRLSGQPTLPHPWDLLADRLEPVVRRGAYDAAIARSQDVARVLLRSVVPTAIYDMANIGFLEEYYTWGPNLHDVEATWRREVELFDAVNWILSPHRLLTDYLVKQFPGRREAVARKVVTVPLGAPRAARVARHVEPPSIVYAGSYHYIQDPWLLAELTRDSPFRIDCFGFHDPNRPFLPSHLNYRGCAPTMEFLADYQFGLITVSRDRLRQHSPATKLPYYFAHGLPVLFPEWMLEGHDYPNAAIPYNEETFADRVAEAAAPERWHAMSASACALGEAMRWDEVLKPLARLLCDC